MNVKELLLEMRRYRMGLIQTAEQLRFSYQSIIHGADAMNIDLRSIVPCPPNYEHSNGGGGGGSDTSSDDDSDDSDDDLTDEDSKSVEVVEEEDDVVSVDSPLHSQINHGGFPVGEVVARIDSSSSSFSVVADSDEPPPPIPPRGESLKSPGKTVRAPFVAAH